ncbi:MAG: 2-oxoacid:ferredoxin oxidoreductase subunit beta [Bacteroidales bacterium]|nr:2-oxoacid:ferredoxin oxidoreductase subunit beta [Bacteroidales bacterium]
MENKNNNNILTKKDFAVGQQVKWCAGCGNYSILSAVTNTLPEIGVKKENVVFVSGIGCSSRFPYYVNTYGFHGIHGRAAPIASGIKLANPDLSVWIITGDGDSMAIGGNHFIHILRRNINVNILLINNKIYGLTKGQYSPTTPFGSITKTSPDGTVENPFKPGELAMGAEATFYARVVDTEPKKMTEVFIEAAKHNGTSLVEILENCVIFNNQVHSSITGKDVKDDNQIYLEHGKRMIFGKEHNKGLILNGLKLEAVTIGENGITEDDILIHDARDSDDTMHYLLTRMTLPEYPIATGIIRSFKSTGYGTLLQEKIEDAKEITKLHSVNDLLNSGNTWEIN